MRRLLGLVLLSLVAFPAQASTTQDDCGTGGDAPGVLSAGIPVTLPLACDGALVEADADEWDVYAVELTEGPVHAELTVGNAGADFVLCIVEPSWAGGACSHESGAAPKRVDVWWPAGPAYVAVAKSGGRGDYHLTVRQQDDCGTGIDALASPAAPLPRAYVRCEAVLDTFLGDAEDAFLVPAPKVPDVVIVRLDPMPPRVQLCVEDDAHALGLRGRCTDATFSRIVVARDPLRPMRVTVEGFTLDALPYTLIVEHAAKNPPQMPPLL